MVCCLLEFSFHVQFYLVKIKCTFYLNHSRYKNFNKCYRKVGCRGTWSWQCCYYLQWLISIWQPIWLLLKLIYNVVTIFAVRQSVPTIHSFFFNFKIVINCYFPNTFFSCCTAWWPSYTYMYTFFLTLSCSIISD